MAVLQHPNIFTMKSSPLLYRNKRFLRTTALCRQVPTGFFQSFCKLAIVFICMVQSFSGHTQTFPGGFAAVEVAGGLSNPTAIAFAQDGRIFIAQQNGVVRVVKNSALLSTPFISLPVQAAGERGLIGIALDPAFATNSFVYLYHTLPDGSRNRIIRLTANGDVAATGSEQLVLNLDPLSSATNHNGGAMHFGPDGKLYVAIGDNANSATAQNLDTYHGKLLRINADGSVPAGNPFTGSLQKSRVWAYGLRNPFTFTFQPGTGKLYVNDVGQNTWEEINDATTGGKNFGWPEAEGNSANTAFTNPVYAYQHGSGDGVGCAITGGTFFNPGSTAYPSEYIGRYFYQDYCNRWINTLSFSGSSVTRQPFATNLGGNSLYITTGPDGNLYYLQRSPGALKKIIYTNNTAPTITGHPASQSVPEGQSVSFSVTASGTAPLQYQWRKNSTDISGATAATYTIASAKPSDAATYSVIVSNAQGSATSNGAQLTVTAANTPPQAQIATPAEGTLYRAGQTISFSGTASDSEDGSLAASAFSWFVEFHHDEHKHDGPPVAQGSKTGSFTIPASGETSADVWFRLVLIVTDSKGLKDTAIRDIHPHKSQLQFRTQPAGLQITLDGQPARTPFAVMGVEGIERTIGPVTLQTTDIKVYTFDRWLHGGAATQTLSTPIPDTVFTAVYKESPFSATRLEAETAQRSGVTTSSMHAGYTGSGFADYVNPSADYVEWTFNAPVATSYQLGFRYALGKEARSMRLQVNGVTIQSSLNFAATGSWTNWAYVNIAANLKTGTNTIRLTATGTSGPNVDHLLLTPQLLEAEDAQRSGPRVVTTSAGYTGTGYIDYRNASGDFIEWTIYKNTAGPVSLQFRYSNGGATDRPLRLQVNGTVINDALKFPPTGGWPAWTYTTATANLTAGMNKIRLTATGASGANIDHLKWSDAGGTNTLQAVALAPKVQSMESSTALRITVTPNPASGKVRLQVGQNNSLPVSIKVYNTAGRLMHAFSVGSGVCCMDMPLSGYAPGLYIITGIQGTQRTTTWLVVQ